MLTNIALVAVELACQGPIDIHAVPEGPIWLCCQREHVPSAISQIRDWCLVREITCQISDLQQGQVASAS